MDNLQTKKQSEVLEYIEKLRSEGWSELMLEPGCTAEDAAKYIVR